MQDFHRYLGEGLFIIYVVVMIIVLVMGRRGKTIPPWLTGAAHALLAVQVAVGVIILMSDGLSGVHWTHPVVGLLAILALGMAPVFKSSFRPPLDKAAVFAVVGVLALAAMLIAQLSR